MVVTLNVKCQHTSKWLRHSYCFIALVTLLWVAIAGASTNGAQRWIVHLRLTVSAVGDSEGHYGARLRRRY